MAVMRKRLSPGWLCNLTADMEELTPHETAVRWPEPKNSGTFHVDGGLPFERAISARPFWPEFEVGTKSVAAANGDLESGLLPSLVLQERWWLP